MRLLLFLAFLMTGCFSPPSQRLNISFQTMPQTADPRKSGDFISATLICMLFEGMTRCGPGGAVEMALAESVEISPDGLRYLFHLRPSVWSDGQPVTAFDFEMSWKEALHPGSVSAYLFYPIRNAEKACKGELPLDAVAIRALDSSRLEVLLERKTDYFLSLTAFPSYLPAPSHRNEQFGNWTKTNEMPFVSNGPFMLGSVEPGSRLLLKKNGMYWKKEAVSLDEIQIAIIGSETTALRMFSKGELDCIGGSISPILPDSLKTIEKGVSLRFFPMNATTFAAFKNDHPALQNRHLRQALSLSINRNEIVESITQMGETAATRFIPPSLVSNQNRMLYPSFDPASANEHLRLALEELQIEKKNLHLTLSYSASELNARIAQTLQKEWRERLGLEIDLSAKEPQTFKDTLYRREFEIALAFWIAQFLDPINILERFEDPENWKNYPGWHSRPFQQAIQSVREDCDRMLWIEKAEEILASDMPLAPIYHWSNPILCNPRVSNLQVTPNGGILIERASTKKL